MKITVRGHFFPSYDEQTDLRNRGIVDPHITNFCFFNISVLSIESV